MKDWRWEDPDVHRKDSKTAPRRHDVGRDAACLLTCLSIWLAAACAYASGGAANGEANWFDFIWRLFNFLVLMGLLYWLLAKRIRDFLASRREGIRTALADAESARQNAQKIFLEYEEKLTKATGEIEQIGETIRAQGLAEKTRLIEDTRKAAEKMKADTEARMDQEFQQASSQLKTEAIQLAAQMAEELLKKQIRSEDHETIVKDYIERVVKRP
jgi:F-type H+-transporting ATPase subunit b